MPEQLPAPDGFFIEGGQVYAPERIGQPSILTIASRIRRIASGDFAGLAQSELEFERLDASGCVVAPALIDVHQHLIGGSGESGGFQSQTPEIFLHELLRAGIATVVGCLGTDTVTKTMPALLAKAKALREQGLSAFLYTGGYPIPHATLTGSVRTDVLFIEEVIGLGELAISDYRSSAPSAAELARSVRAASVAGMLSGKAGVTHFHVGEQSTGLGLLRDLIDDYAIDPASLYPTHVERNETLFDEAIELTRRGATVDVDVVEQDLPRWVQRYLASDADPQRLTASSDAAINSPATLLKQLIACCDENIPLDRVLMLASTNPARVLKLYKKGRIAVNQDADILVFERQTGKVRHLLSSGRLMVRDGELQVREAFLGKTNRRVELYGQTK